MKNNNTQSYVMMAIYCNILRYFFTGSQASFVILFTKRKIEICIGMC